MLPSLAVADALRARGDAAWRRGRPVAPKRSWFLKPATSSDTFEISGFPREAEHGAAAVPGARRQGSAACRKILERRRPDVVLGGGGYVAGPMVFAAATRRIPAALMEADAHLGLANRLALPFARRVFLPHPRPRRGEVPSDRAAGARELEGTPRDEGRRRFDLPADGPLLLVYGGSQGARTLNELVVDAFADEGPLVLHLAGERDFKLLRDRVRREGYRLLPWTHDFGAALPLRTSPWLARAGRCTSWLRLARRPCSSRIPTRREIIRRRMRGTSRRPAPPWSFPSEMWHGCRLSSGLCSPTRRGWSGWPRKCGGWPGRTQPRRSQTTCSRLPVLSGRKLWFAGIGGAGMSALAVVSARGVRT